MRLSLLRSWGSRELRWGLSSCLRCGQEWRRSEDRDPDPRAVPWRDRGRRGGLPRGDSGAGDPAVLREPGAPAWQGWRFAEGGGGRHDRPVFEGSGRAGRVHRRAAGERSARRGAAADLPGRSQSLPPPGCGDPRNGIAGCAMSNGRHTVTGRIQARRTRPLATGRVPRLRHRSGSIAGASAAVRTRGGSARAARPRSRRGRVPRRVRRWPRDAPRRPRGAARRRVRDRSGGRTARGRAPRPRP